MMVFLVYSNGMEYNTKTKKWVLHYISPSNKLNQFYSHTSIKINNKYRNISLGQLMGIIIFGYELDDFGKKYNKISVHHVNKDTFGDHISNLEFNKNQDQFAKHGKTMYDFNKVLRF